MFNLANSPLVLLGAVFVIIAGAGNYILKTMVLERQDQLQALQAEIIDEKDRITVLEADWSYLTRPSRIQHLSEEMLSFAPVEPERILQLDALEGEASSADDDFFQIKTIKELE